MPIVNGNYYMNGDYGQGLEQGKIADAFPGLAAQTGSGSWADRLVDHLTTPRSAVEPPPPPAPPSMPPEAYDEMKINQLTVRQVANVVANENHDVTPGTSSPEELQEARIAQAHAVINADRKYGLQRMRAVHTASDEITPELENSLQYKQALDASRTAFQQQLSGYDPLGGRIHFNNRDSPSTGLYQLGSEKVAVYGHFGPFQLGNGTKYTNIYENPKNMARPRSQ
jgi:hypothetical protein